MVAHKIISFKTLCLILISVCFSNGMHAAVALNHGRGGPHKFGWQNTSDRGAYRRAFVSERALEKRQQRKLMGKKLYKHMKNENDKTSRYEHSY